MEQATVGENRLLYRAYEPGDEEGILRLWKEESGWGEITLQQFQDWFLNTPYGSCIIVVATNEDNQILGQIIYAPSRVIIEGKEVKALRSAAPILDASLRGANLRSLKHPAFLLIEKGFEIAARLGYQLVYSFPAYGWVGMMQMINKMLPNPSETASFECFAISLNELPTFASINNAYHLDEFQDFTEEHEQLWNEALQQMPVHCAIQRQYKWMNWSMGNNLKLALRSNADNQLVGYISIKRDSGLISDVVARNIGDLTMLYHHVVHRLHQSNAACIKVPFTQLKGMMTKESEVALKNIDFVKDPYRFAFGSYLLDTSLDFEKIRTPNWYMTPLG